MQNDDLWGSFFPNAFFQITHLRPLWSDQLPGGPVAFFFFWSRCLSGALLPEAARGGEEKAVWSERPSLLSPEHTQALSSECRIMKAISFIFLFPFSFLFWDNFKLVAEITPVTRRLHSSLTSRPNDVLDGKEPSQDHGRLLPCPPSAFVRWSLSLSLTFTALLFLQSEGQPFCRMSIDLRFPDIS